jgi:hypothetical protein
MSRPDLDAVSSTADLGERLAAAKAEAISAEEAVGRAVLDGKDEPASRKALRAVHDEVEGLEAAQREEERRAVAEQEREARNAESEKRQGTYEWVAHYLEVAIKVIDRRKELATAERELHDTGANRFLFAVRGFFRGLTPENSGMDLQIVAVTPDPPQQKLPVKLSVAGEMNRKVAEANLARARELAVGEEKSRA